MNILQLPPIDWVLRQFFRQRARALAQGRDLQLINEAAEQLNKEALDVLGYQFGKQSHGRVCTECTRLPASASNSTTRDGRWLR